jgi:hypothetical protein
MCLMHEAAVADRHLSPEIPEHLDGHKSTKQQEDFVHDTRRHGFMGRSVADHERYAGLEEFTERKVRIQLSICTDKLGLLCQQVEHELSQSVYYCSVNRGGLLRFQRTLQNSVCEGKLRRRSKGE